MRPVSLTWAGGEHDFLLTIGLLRALQDRCDAGPEWVLNRLRTGQWRVDDVIETIRLGLEGGGMTKDAARKLTNRYVEEQPIALSVMTAQLVIAASIYDRGDDQVGEDLGEAGSSLDMSPSLEESGDLAATTETATL